ncbi:adenylate/guanylate cyclase domain-containing protein [Ruegeria marina]|nr:adenylate/guanylate cyclase domain-containing protein [Ruegeria marina]
MAADIVGYSAMMGADEEGTLHRVRGWHEGIFTPIVKQHGGRIFKTMGDGVLAEFTSAAQAVACAIASQRAMEKLEDGNPDSNLLQIRIGINHGDLIYQDGDVFGDCVNVAARLEGMAVPGGILVSDAVIVGLAQAEAQGFHDNGNRKFKNIARPIRVWSWPDKLPSLRAATKPRLLIKGFSFRSSVEDEAGGILIDELYRHLARLTGFEVVQDEESAHYFVDGAVRLTGDRCRLSVRLVRVDEGRQIWAIRYDGAGDPFDFADRFAPRLAMSLRRRVAADYGERLRAQPLDEMSLEDLMALAGASFFNPTYEGWHGAGVIAEQALELDANAFMALAMAAAGLGLANALYAFDPVPGPVLEKAMARIKQATRLNNRSDMIHTVHAGLLLHGYRRHSEARVAVAQALQINPDYNMALWVLGEIQIFSGDPDAGIENARRAIDIAPDDPYVHLYSRAAGYGYLMAGRPDSAIEWFRQADHLAPDLAPNLLGLAICAGIAVDDGEATQARDAFLRLAPAFRVSTFDALPFRDVAQRDRLRTLLIDAGLPI